MMLPHQLVVSLTCGCERLAAARRHPAATLTGQWWIRKQLPGAFVSRVHCHAAFDHTPVGYTGHQRLFAPRQGAAQDLHQSL